MTTRCNGIPWISAEGFPPQQITCPHRTYCQRYLRAEGDVVEPRRQGGRCLDLTTEEIGACTK